MTTAIASNTHAAIIDRRRLSVWRRIMAEGRRLCGSCLNIHPR
ncbi:MAG: hypothetical protein QG554_2462 [Pseudomonadota bacterium]|jgi:hypothetical protein|nr:hypothetical protein [Pseudomonadota bacterium]